MKSPLTITSILTKVVLPNTAVENIINYRQRKEKTILPATGIDRKLTDMQYETVMPCSAQVAVKGGIKISCVNNRTGAIEIMEIPVKPAFLVTCIRGKEGRYKMSISSSLS